MYATCVIAGYVWYAVCYEEYYLYPYWIASPLFELVDGRLSRYWVVSIKDPTNRTASPTWAFPEWANNVNFFEHMLEGSSEEIDLFQKYKKKMDLEFPSKEIIKKAEIGDENWLICTNCFDA